MTYKGRPSWSAYGLMLAEAVALRADCRRMKVGAVIFSRDHRVVSTGYNGAPAGEPGCLAGHCPRGLLSTEEVTPLSSYDSGPGKCVSVHAEANALMYGDRERWQGGAMYTTYKPCPTCLKLIRGSGLASAASTCGWYWIAGGDPDGFAPVDQGTEVHGEAPPDEDGTVGEAAGTGGAGRSRLADDGGVRGPGVVPAGSDPADRHDYGGHVCNSDCGDGGHVRVPGRDPGGFGLLPVDFFRDHHCTAGCYAFGGFHIWGRYSR